MHLAKSLKKPQKVPKWDIPTLSFIGNEWKNIYKLVIKTQGGFVFLHQNLKTKFIPSHCFEANSHPIAKPEFKLN